MRILLPPSEGKAAPEGGEPVDLDSLAFAAELGEQRRALLDALERCEARPRGAEALAVRGGGRVAVDARCAAPAAPAAEVYTGVLYDARLPGCAQRRRRS